MASQNKETYRENDDDYLFLKQLKRKKEVWRLEQKEIEMIKVIGKNKENVKLQQMN
jgi:hypothetical protein